MSGPVQSLLARLARPNRIPAVSSVVAPPTVTWPDSVTVPVVSLPCPNCGDSRPKPLKITVNFATPDHPLRHSRVLTCNACTCLFYEDQRPPDYTEEAMLGRGRTAFYLQQGAGVSLITRPLAMVQRPAGSSYLEVGCGFGFGLDFAIRAKGWRSRGIDPAGISALGRELLGLPIDLRYLAEDEPGFAGACDVVMASETIEHVPSPAAFLLTLRKALCPGGILILTTPNAAEIDPSRSPGMLVPLLSPGLHLVLQTAESLRGLLRQAGFAHIREETDSASLVAFASDAPIVLQEDRSALRESYRAYLDARAQSVPRDGDLVLAFAGRCLQESANDRDWPGAERAYELLREICRERFGFDLDALDTLPEETATCPLERLAELMPLNLGGILFADGMRRLALGLAPRGELGGRFACAATAADAVRRALGELAMEDGMSELIGWAARAEGLLCDTAAGEARAIDGFAALPPAPPGGEVGAVRRDEIAERALAWLVNAGHVALGGRLAEAAGLQTRDWANPSDGDTAQPPLADARRDALFCLGVIDAQLDGSGDPARGRRRLRTLRRTLQAYGRGSAGADFPLAVLRCELQAIRLTGDEAAEAETIAEALAALPDLAPSDAAELAARATEASRQLLVRYVNAGEYDAARSYADAISEEAFAADETVPLTPARQDALFALAVLDTQPEGDAARAEKRFARLRASLRPPPGKPVRDLLWAALRGELQAVAQRRGAGAAEAHRRSLLADLNGLVEETPADLLAPIPHDESAGPN